MATKNSVAVPHDMGSPEQARQFAVQVKKRLDYIDLGIVNPASGSPTDEPAERTMRFDPSTKRLWIYDGADWRYVVLT